MRDSGVKVVWKKEKIEKWWDPLAILGKFCNVKKWVGHPKEETVKNLEGQSEYYFSINC